MKRILLAVFGLMAAVGLLAWRELPNSLPAEWTPAQRALIQSLSLSQLPATPGDPSNAVAELELAAQLGHRLYFDKRLSGNGEVACANCHKPQNYFTDTQTLAVGTQTGFRHTPSLVGLSYSPWFYWDGRKDSQWAQALAPIETSHEHNLDRLQVVRLIAEDPLYTSQYESLFNTLPDLPAVPRSASPLGDERLRLNWESLDTDLHSDINQAFANVGKALAAYQRKIKPGRSRFDDYADSLITNPAVVSGSALSKDELAGLALFIDQAQCISCHNGPLLTNFEFHNTGVLAIAGQLPSMGRYEGIKLAREDEFNCLGKYSDAEPAQCIELKFAKDDNDLVGAQKTPTLRNITETAPYMHGGQIADLKAVMEHYNEAPTSMLSHNEAKPLALRPIQLEQLEAFMTTLTAPLQTERKWLLPPAQYPSRDIHAGPVEPGCHQGQ